MVYLMNKDDRYLIHAFREGNHHAFNILFQRHKARLGEVIYYTVKDRILAEDLLQEVFIRIVQAIKNDRYIEEGKFIHWATVMAKNHCIDHIRKQKRQTVRYCTTDTMNNLHVHEPVAQQESSYDFPIHLLMQAIDKLPDGQVQVVRYRLINGLSFKEIAGIMDTSINTAIGRMRYGIINLRKTITPAGRRVA